MTLDPWRYRCVECGSTQLVYRCTNMDSSTPIRGGVRAKKRYYCGNCANKSNKRKDMKTGKVVA